VTRSRLARTCVLTSVCATLLTTSACGMTFTRPTSASSGCTAGQVSTAPDPKPFTANVSPDPAAAGQVPPKVKAKGRLVIAEDPSYAPNEFTSGDSNQPVGMDIDLANAIGKTLGLKITFANSSFDGIIAGIQAGRYDLGMSSFTDSAEREKTVDFVTYFKAGTSILVPKCNPQKITSYEDLCGKRVGAENGTTQIDQLSKADADGSIVKLCTSKGKKPPIPNGFPQQTDASSALQAGRIDALIADSPVVDYIMKKRTGAFEKGGSDQGVAPYGIAVPKNAGTLKTALQTAINTLIKNGTYRKIMDNWGVADGSIEKSELNQAKAGG
jgi:polar amino acid transport system substrate-binding protein